MPKRREVSIHVADGEFKVGMNCVVFTAEQDRETPSFRLPDGAQERFNISLSEMEEPRWRSLWDRFQENPQELSPEELGELMEYTRRRLNLPLLEFFLYRDGKTAAVLAERMAQFSQVWATRAEINVNNVFSPSDAENILRALEMASGKGTYSTSFEQLRQRALTGEELTFEEQFLLKNYYSAKLEEERRSLQKTITQSLDPHVVTSAYRRYTEFFDKVAPFLSSDQRAFFEAWKERAGVSVDAALRRAGSVNLVERSWRPSRKGVIRLPDPPETGVFTNRIAFFMPKKDADLLRSRVEELGFRVVGVLYTVPDDVRVVVNLGNEQLSPAVVAEFTKKGIRVINPDVSRTADKAQVLSLLGDLAPWTTRDWRRAAELFGHKVVAKVSRGKTNGEGTALLDFSSEDVADRARCFDLFQKKLNIKDEWRVIVFVERALTAYRKVPKLGTGTFRSEHRERISHLPAAAVETALEACRRIGIEFAEVNVVRDRQGKYWTLGLNTIPDMSKETLFRLAEEVSALFQEA